MIRFDAIESRLDELNQMWRTVQPFQHFIIDEFCDADRLLELYNLSPDPEKEAIGKSRDYVFAKNKYEKSAFKELGGPFREVYDDLISDRFAQILKKITEINIFPDSQFWGGGLHMGGKGSFLDMHADFNYHPAHDTWLRELNVLLYLNVNWEPSWGGQLKLRHLTTNVQAEVEPVFNRCVVMLTKDHTLHGYAPINFPDGLYRRSIAAYYYQLAEPKGDQERSTTWYPENSSFIKKVLGKHWPALVRIKTQLLGSATGRNQ